MASGMRIGEWLRRIDKAGPDAATLICGPEVFLRDLGMRRLKERLFGSAEKAALNHDRFYGDEGPLTSVTLALASVGLFSGIRLVTLGDPERAGRAGTADKRELLEALERGTPGSYFVATSDLTAWELERKNEWTRGLMKRCRIVEVQHPSTDEAGEWLFRESRRRNIPLDPGAGAFLLSRVGPLLQELSRELDKLEVLASSGEPVTEEVLRESMRRGSLGSVRDFADAVLAGRAGEALRLREAVGRTEAAMRVQWTLQRAARDRIARGGTGGRGPGLSQVLAQAYAWERGIKSGAIPPSAEWTAGDMLVSSACAEGVRPGQKDSGMRRR